MRRLIATLAALLLGYQPNESGHTSSLDQRFTELRKHGGLANFCVSNSNVGECQVGIGAWKPDALERIRSQAIQCIDTCPLDTYGFVYSTDGTRFFPQVYTKDFDSSAPSRGVEFRLFPVAVEILKYEGCAGCPLIKTSPRNVKARAGVHEINLPLISYGIFYLPREFRRLALANASAGLGIDVTIDLGKSKENRTISPTALREYSRMITDLNYHLLP